MAEGPGSILSPQDCEKVLFGFDRNAKLLNFEINRIGDKVFGFLAEHYYLTIKYSKNNQSGTDTRRFFLKTMPKLNDTQKMYIENMGIFRKEILNYKNFIPEFLKFADKPFAPKYYFSKNDECLVIEDLSSLNYQVCSLEYLDNGKCIGALKALVGLHGASLIFEELNSTKERPYRLNEQFSQELVEATFSFQEGHVRYMWCKTATKCLQKLTPFFTKDNEIAIKIEQYIFSEDGLRKFLKPSKKYRNVVCHDDLWRNNLMFNDKDECVLVDFQLTRYTAPVFDVLLLLYLGTEKKYFDKNIKHYLNLYYRLLANELSRYELDIENIISQTEFLASVEEYTLPALTEACMYGTNVYLPEEISNAVISSPETFINFTLYDRPSFIVKEFERNSKFRERFSNVLKPLFEIMEEF